MATMIFRASVLFLVLVCTANASSPGLIAGLACTNRVHSFEPRMGSEPRSLGLRGKRQNLALRGGAKPVNDEDAAHLLGKTLVFVSAGYEAKKATIDIAHARGVNIIVVDEPTSWASPTNPNTLDREGKVQKFVAMDMNRADAILVPNILAQLEQYTTETGKKIDGICSFVELCTETAAKVAEGMNLPCSPSSSVALARSKPATRNCCEAAGLPKVTHYVLNTRSDIQEAIKEVHFPAVMKPISGVSSLGVLKVERPEDLERVYDESIAHMKSVVVGAGGLLMKAEKPLAEVADRPRSSSAAQERIATFVVEEYLNGYELDIDLVMEDGKCIYRLLTDNGPCAPPYFSESWSLVPSVQLTEQQVKETEQLAIDSALAMGLTHGVFHVEAMYTPRGARLIEFNARMGGGEVYETNLKSTGVCLVVEALLLACGIPRTRVLRANGDPLLASVAGSSVSAPCSGSLHNVDAFLEKYRSMSGVSWMSPKVVDNQHIIGPDEGMPDWIAIFLIEFPPGRGQEALDKALEIEKLMTQDFLDEMDVQRAATPLPGLQGPRRTQSTEWHLDASLTRGIE